VYIFGRTSSDIRDCSHIFPYATQYAIHTTADVGALVRAIYEKACRYLERGYHGLCAYAEDSVLLESDPQLAKLESLDLRSRSVLIDELIMSCGQRIDMALKAQRCMIVLKFPLFI
jgi:hypothetical protein